MAAKKAAKLFAAGFLAMLLNGLLMSLVAVAAEPAAGPVTFNKDVLPILQQNCQACHRPGQIAPFSLLTYENARPMATAMKNAVMTRKMPPWFADPKHGKFSNDTSLEQSEIDTIVAWADQGAPEGDAKDKPAPVKWPEAGWQIQPDHIVDVPETLVPAHAGNHDSMEWAVAVIPSGFTEDTWVSSIEILPDHREVTHHMCVRFMPHYPDVVYNTFESRRKNIQRDEHGVEVLHGKNEARLPSNVRDAGANEHCYLPGNIVENYSTKNVAKLVPAGTDLAITTHYTPNGKEVLDRPRIGFKLAKAEPQRKWISYALHGLQDRKSFAIPPNDPGWAAPAGIITLMEDAELVWMSPHMHYRGKDMTYTVIYPDGESKIALRVPQYAFEWQMGYELAEPIKLPKNSRIMITGHFDNSPSKPYNPDPNQTVYYGDMSWEEMFTGFIGLIVDKDVDPRKIIREDVPVSAATGGGG